MKRESESETDRQTDRQSDRQRQRENKASPHPQVGLREARGDWMAKEEGLKKEVRAALGALRDKLWAEQKEKEVGCRMKEWGRRI